MRFADRRTWLAMRDEAGSSTQICDLAGDVHFALCDANGPVKCELKPPTLIRAWMYPTAKMQFSKCRKFYHSAYRLFIGAISDFWATRLMRRMRCRKPYWPLTGISINSGGRR